MVEGGLGWESQGGCVGPPGMVRSLCDNERTMNTIDHLSGGRKHNSCDYLLVDEDVRNTKWRIWFHAGPRVTYIGVVRTWDAVLALQRRFNVSYRLVHHNTTWSRRSS